MHYVNVVKALFDYEAQTPEELSFEVRHRRTGIANNLT